MMLPQFTQADAVMFIKISAFFSFQIQKKVQWKSRLIEIVIFGVRHRECIQPTENKCAYNGTIMYLCMCPGDETQLRSIYLIHFNC